MDIEEMKKELKERIEKLSEEKLKALLKQTKPISEQDIIDDIRNNPVRY